MADVPMKAIWMGENGPEEIETLPREKLIEIIHHLNRDLEQTRASAVSVSEIWRMGNEIVSRHRART